VTQREIGVDVPNFAEALRRALRQDPDVILVGEMRDAETIEIALTAAETGHLVMSTLHTMDATETIARVVSVFPPHHQKAIRMQLASVLKAVVSQRLVPRADSRGRVAAMEVLKATARIRELIEDADLTKEIPEAIAQGYTTYGTQTFDQSLMALLKQNVISYQEALRQASNPDDFALRVSGISGTSDSTWDSFETPGAAPAPVRKMPAMPITQSTPPPQPGQRAKTAQPVSAAAHIPNRPAPQVAAKEDEFERF
jgi:twitching motility protein PilT